MFILTPEEEAEKEIEVTALNEAGDDDAGDDTGDADAEEEEDTESEDSDDGADNGGSDDAGTEEEKAEPKVPFQNLDLESVICFGWSPSVHGRQSWFHLADQSITKGWKNTDVKALGDDLMKNVDACYFFVVQADFVNIDDSMEYHVQFVNDKRLWYLSIKDSPNAEIQPEEAKNFFSSEFFKKFARRCYDLISRALKMYNQIIDIHFQDGEFLQVSEIKLGRILYEINTSKFMDNLLNCRYGLK